MKKTAQKKDNNALIISRIFDAPRTLVWKAWTDPEQVRRWWGPKIFTTPVAKIDLRPGGKYLYCMRSPDGRDFWSTGVFREIVEPERIVATDSFSDEKGNVVPASFYGMDWDWPPEVPVTITFKETGGRTTLSLLYDRMPPKEMAEPMTAGWNESFDKLTALLGEEMMRRAKTTITAEPGIQEASLTRIFNAPRERLFSAYTDPKLIPLWWAPARFSIVVERMEVKPGGTWRFLNRDAEGNDYWFHGVYHEISPARIVYTFEFEGLPGHVVLGIVNFEEHGGKTKVVEKSVFESVEDRDGMLREGMAEGGLEVMDRLAELVEKP